MIYLRNIEMSTRYYGSKAIIAVYKGAKLVWEAVKSCFGKGAWFNNKGWSNKDGWKN